MQDNNLEKIVREIAKPHFTQMKKERVSVYSIKKQRFEHTLFLAPNWRDISLLKITDIDKPVIREVQ